MGDCTKTLVAQPNPVAARLLYTYMSARTHLENAAEKINAEEEDGVTLGNSITSLITYTTHEILETWMAACIEGVEDCVLCKYRVFFIEDVNQRLLATEMALLRIKGVLDQRALTIPIHFVLASTNLDPALRTYYLEALGLPRLDVVNIACEEYRKA